MAAVVLVTAVVLVVDKSSTLGNLGTWSARVADGSTM
jgi:hypothetical protein